MNDGYKNEYEYKFNGDWTKNFKYDPEAAEKLLLAYREKVQKYLESEWGRRAAYDSLFNSETSRCFKLNESVNNCAGSIAQSMDDGSVD